MALYIQKAAEYLGININLKAFNQLHKALPEVNAIWGPARELPFRDRWFDLVFTMGVLIHQPDSTLPLVMAEIVRCSRRCVLCGEYYAEQPTECFSAHTVRSLSVIMGGCIRSYFPELELHKPSLGQR